MKLEQRMVLLAWLNDLFGYENNRDLLADMRDAGEGFDASSHSYIYYRLLAQGDKVKMAPGNLARHDDNIRLIMAEQPATAPSEAYFTGLHSSRRRPASTVISRAGRIYRAHTVCKAK